MPHVGIIAFEDGRIASEHIFWDHATVLLQLGVLGEDLPALGADQAARLLNSDAPANTLITKFAWAVTIALIRLPSIDPRVTVDLPPQELRNLHLAACHARSCLNFGAVAEALGPTELRV